MLSGKVFGQRLAAMRGGFCPCQTPNPNALENTNTKCRWHINTPSEPFNRDSRRLYGRVSLDIAKCSVSCYHPFNAYIRG